MRAITTVVLAISCVVTGCKTALVSNQMATGSQTAANGLMYRLPKKQFDLTVTHELVSCSVDPASNVTIGAKVTGTVAESVVGDDDQTYFLNYNELSAWTKVSKIDIGVTDTGLLTSINSTMTDQTGPIITNVGTAAFSVARGIALASVPGASAITLLKYQNFDAASLPSVRGRKVQKPSDLCETFNKAREEYVDAGKAAKAAAASAKERNDDLALLARRKTLNAQLKEEQSFYKQYGTPGQYKAATEAVETSAKALIDAQTVVDASKAADSDLEKKNKALADAKAKLFVESTFSFVPTLKNQGIDETLQYSRIDSLFAPTVFPCTDTTQKNCVVLPKVKFSVTPIAGTGSDSPRFKDEKVGVAYRLPATALLQAKADDKVVFVKLLTQVPQYGRIGSLDLSNGVFADNMLKINFNANGAPTQLSFSSQSQGEAASKAASQTAQAYFDFAKNRQQDRIDAAKTQTGLDKDRIGLEKDRIGLDKDRASANASVASDNLNTLRDIQRLQLLANGTASEATSQLDALNHQRDMLEAQLKVLALQKQIKDAQASLAAPSGQ